MNVEPAEQTKQIDVQDLDQEMDLAMQVKTKDKESETDSAEIHYRYKRIFKRVLQEKHNTSHQLRQ